MVMSQRKCIIIDYNVGGSRTLTVAKWQIVVMVLTNVGDGEW